MTSSLPFFLVDAFTLGRCYTGNPAAVCILPPYNDNNTNSPSSMKQQQQQKLTTAKEMTLPSNLFDSDQQQQQQEEKLKLTTKYFQKVANEMKQSETVFVQLVPNLKLSPEETNNNNNNNTNSDDEDDDSLVFFIRWFSPTTEVPLCGHATLAATHCLFSHYLPSLMNNNNNNNNNIIIKKKKDIRFINYITNTGRIFRVSKATTDSSSSSSSSSSFRYTLRFPNNKPSPVIWKKEKDTNNNNIISSSSSPSLETYGIQVVAALQESELLISSSHEKEKKRKITDHIKNVWYHPGSKKYLVELDNPNDVVNLKLDIGKLCKLLTKKYVASVTVTADNTKNNNNTNNANNNNVVPVALSRHFAPWVGINEDEVTGAAHVVLVPMYFERFFGSSAASSTKKELPFFQAFPNRGGILFARVEPTAVYLTGAAYTVVKGELTISKKDINNSNGNSNSSCTTRSKL